jgi:hypothetical protein
MKRNATAMKVAITFAASAVIAFVGRGARADMILVSDDLLGSGPLAGTAADLVPSNSGSTWSTIYSDNGGELSPSVQTDSTGAGWPSAVGAGQTAPVDGQRSASGVNVGGYNNHVDDNAYIGITPFSTGLITATDTFSFPNTNATGNPTAWGFLALLQSVTNPDVINNANSVGPWALVRPRSNGTDVVEIYATGGTGNKVTTTNVEANNVALPHTIQLFFDPAAGTLNASVDGTTLLATPYQYGGSHPAIPSIDGVEFGNRTNTGVATATNPSTTFFTGVSVSQVPEPTSLGLLAAGSLIALRRHRRAQ